MWSITNFVGFASLSSANASIVSKIVVVLVNRVLSDGSVNWS